VRTSSHASGWLENFTKAIADLPEVVEAHRLAGEIDYILKVYVRDAEHYDQFYRQLVDRVEIFNVTSALSMETVKSYSGIAIEDL
jgi:Lrp/AsnC family transcriptional regulator